MNFPSLVIFLLIGISINVYESEAFHRPPYRPRGLRPLIWKKPMKLKPYGSDGNATNATSNSNSTDAHAVDSASQLSTKELLTYYLGPGSEKYDTDYGNHCGLRNPTEGQMPKVIDGCDRCCYNHKICYEKVEDLFDGCDSHKKTYAFYKVHAKCHEPWRSCAQAVCQCDLQLTRCLKRRTSKKDQVCFPPFPYA